MNLSDYLKATGRPVAEFVQPFGVKSVAQIQQWQHRYANRLPGAASCVLIEKATGGMVRRWDLRPDWHLIWPELIGIKGAPRSKSRKAA